MPGLAPVDVIQRLLSQTGHEASDLNVIELMEAFAVQAIACADGAELPADKINVGGGSLARGHPIGASGAILAVRLFHELKRSGGSGLAAIAAAGGLGTAMIVDSIVH